MLDFGATRLKHRIAVRLLLAGSEKDQRVGLCSSFSSSPVKESYSVRRAEELARTPQQSAVEISDSVRSKGGSWGIGEAMSSKASLLLQGPNT